MIAVLGSRFIRNCWGLIAQPYTTMRRLSIEGDSVDGFGMWCAVFIGFVFIALLRSRSLHPFLLTYNFGLLTTGVVFTALLTVLGIYVIGKLVGGQGELRTIVVTWSMTLLPTLIWFIAASFSYLVLPPPRNLTILGKLFSLVFIAGSVALFFWKGMLYYLTLRFGMRLSMSKILIVSAIIFPLGVLYSIVMYKVGIFRIPFI